MATVIQIKRSQLAAAPDTEDLSLSEMAYAQDKANDGADAKLYIETINSSDQPEVHAIGGYHYTRRIDNATSAATPSTLVERDGSGGFAGDLTGNASTATAFETPQQITFEDQLDENGVLSEASDVRGTITFDGSGALSAALSVVGAEANQVTGNVLANDGTTVVENGTNGTDAFLRGDVRSNDGLVTVLDSGTDGTDATFMGDILSTGGQTVLDSGTDGTDAAFTGSVDGVVGGNTPAAVTGTVITANTNFAGDLTGDVTGNVSGNAGTATALETARNFSVTGDATAPAVSFDGTDNAALNVTLNTQAGLVANAYGSTTAVPVVTVNEKGLVTAISTQAIATNLDIAGDTGTDTVAGGEQLTFAGTAGEIETTVTDNQVQIGLPDNVSVTGTMGVGGKLTVTGDLEVNGSLTTVNSTDLEVVDGLIRLGKGNTSNALDLGFVAQYNDGADRYAGLYRDKDDGKFHFFNTEEDLETATEVNKLLGSYNVNTIVANLESGAMTIADGGLTGGTISGLATDLAVADGGTGASSFTEKGVLLGNGTGALAVTAVGQQGQVLTASADGTPTFSGIDGGTF